MDLQVPLNRLKFGHDDGAGINARTTGRDEGIADLAANIHARGQIENLVVKDAGGGFYSVSNGNRRLAAFHMIYGVESTEAIRCTLRDVDQAGAFEDSLTTAVTAKQLHPVDQYEAFARLRDQFGKSDEETAKHYGMTPREVEQVLALGHLSPNIRAAWRAGEIKEKAAKAFTLAADHKAQDEALRQLQSDNNRGDIDDYDVKDVLKIDENVGLLVEFVGIDAYVKRGGKVTRDLFGTDHQVSDAKLAAKMADERLAAECDRLKKAGWSFAVTERSVQNTKWNYSALKVEGKPTPEEAHRVAELEKAAGDDIGGGRTEAQEQSLWQLHGLEEEIQLRAYTPKLMEKSGCFVSIDSHGRLAIEYGKVKPAQKESATKVEREERKEQKKAEAKSAKAAGQPAPESKVLSNALIQRLEAQLIGATRDAIGAEPQLVNSPMFEILAKTICSMINPDQPFHMPDGVRTKLPSIRQTLNAGIFNAAVAKRFDAEDYFSNAPKGFVLKAIAEAINQDEARRVAGKSKSDIGKFALQNLGKSGWLPKELRTVHYRGPGSEGYKPPVVTAPAPPKPATTADGVKLAKAQRETKKKDIQMKRAAAAKKSVKKTSKKKR